MSCLVVMRFPLVILLGASAIAVGALACAAESRAFESSSSPRDDAGAEGGAQDGNGLDASAPARDAVSVLLTRTPPPAVAFLAIGFPVFGRRAIRADMAERVAHHAREHGADLGPVAAWLGCPAGEVDTVVAALLSPTSPPDDDD